MQSVGFINFGEYFWKAYSCEWVVNRAGSD